MIQLYNVHHYILYLFFLIISIHVYMNTFMFRLGLDLVLTEPDCILFFMFLEEYIWLGKKALPVLCAWSFHAGLEDKHDQENYRTLCYSNCLHFAEQVCGKNLHQNKKSTPEKEIHSRIFEFIFTKVRFVKAVQFYS